MSRSGTHDAAPGRSASDLPATPPECPGRCAVHPPDEESVLRRVVARAVFSGHSRCVQWSVVRCSVVTRAVFTVTRAVFTVTRAVEGVSRRQHVHHWSAIGTWGPPRSTVGHSPTSYDVLAPPLAKVAGQISSKLSAAAAPEQFGRSRLIEPRE